jgi:hypothetical protein
MARFGKNEYLPKKDIALPETMQISSTMLSFGAVISIKETSAQ